MWKHLNPLLELKELRNNICHAMEFAQDPERALGIPSLTRLALTMIEEFEQELGGGK